MARDYKPGFGIKVANVLMKGVLRFGFGPPGIVLLSVRGRRSGGVFTTPVSPVQHERLTYVVSPYGERGWTKNVRAAGELTLGRGGHPPAYRVHEVAAAEAGPVLRQYWHEAKITRPYFDVTPESPDEAWASEAPKHPVFRLEAK